ncbi:hypothetical protein Pint_29524 [Pistacia integerrima]|uniref:Uncharacterized protein n=1 Tax=Pistacia integerrima TaxID=434235 RepID=A0ACC0WZF1_9ROSI|nr:hypothetical protein Pint_29524 [Pistacia integerrima]
MYGNYDELGNIPQFDLYAGPNKWATVTLKNVSTNLIRELIHVLPTSYFHVCLVNTGSGTPFINALEIRPLKNTVYKTESGSLNLFIRLDVASLTNQIVRYKEDVYDRIWNPYNSVGWGQLSTNFTIDSNSSNDFQPAPVVMSTATAPENVSASLDFFLDIDDTSLQFYVYLHFAEVLPLPANETREMNISVVGRHWYGPFRPNYLSTTTVYSTSALTGGKYTFKIQRTESSTQPPILNAIEAYSVKNFSQSQTEQKDFDAITNIKSMYEVKRNWQGDPCVPQAYLWDGLNCSYSDASIPPKITSLNLSSSGLTGEIPRYISNLRSLQSLDLSNNSLNGSVPDFLSQLPLTFLNLKGNNFSGSVPVALLDRSKNGSLTLRSTSQHYSEPFSIIHDYAYKIYFALYL